MPETPTLMIIHHSPSPDTAMILEKVINGVKNPELPSGTKLIVSSALGASSEDFLKADGYIFGTTANIGYMSGALKHFFDLNYYLAQEAVKKRPYGFWVYGNSDVAGAKNSITKIADGMGLILSASALEITQKPNKQIFEQCEELGAQITASLYG